MMEKYMLFSRFRSYVARRRDATALKGRAAASAPSSYFWRVLIDFRLLMVCIFIFFVASSPPSPFHCRPLSVHGSYSRRRRQAPLSTHIEPSGCTAPMCVRRPSSTSVPSFLSGPFRAPRGRLPGATVAPPPGMGWTLRTGISPRGPPKVARGEVPKVPDCRTTDSFWGPFWYPLFRPTCTQFYEK